MKDSTLPKSCLLIIFLSCIRSINSQSITIQTSSGPIQGTNLDVDGRTVYQYLGIPYAEPPLGDLRFRRTQPIQPWSETLKAIKMPPACMQYTEEPLPWYDTEPGKSEDCLYLNIWAPESNDGNNEKSKKSVMFWIHGGGFITGSIRMPDYDGRFLAAKGDVIIVTINYRLGAFGFFTTDTDAAPTNNCLYDMLEALKWVNNNIDAFGGDPNQVTLFGQSVGSATVGLFCVSPLTKGLFNKVIMQSGSPVSIQHDVKATSIEKSQKLAEAVGCASSSTTISNSAETVSSCMREADSVKIAKTLHSLNTDPKSMFYPTYGSEFVPENAREALKAGKFHDVSVLIGSNRDEGSVILTEKDIKLFGYFGEKLSNFNVSRAEKFLLSIFRDDLKDYPGTHLVVQFTADRLKEGDDGNNLKLVYDVLSDFIFMCPDVYMAESLSRFDKNVYFYFFNHRPSNSPYAQWMGVAHFDEVQFVFGSPLKDSSNYTKEEIKLSKLMMKMWSDFAKYGDPFYDESKRSRNDIENDVILGKWPAYSGEIPLYLILDKTTTKVKRYFLGPHKINCELFREAYGFL